MPFAFQNETPWSQAVARKIPTFFSEILNDNGKQKQKKYDFVTNQISLKMQNQEETLRTKCISLFHYFFFNIQRNFRKTLFIQ